MSDEPTPGAVPSTESADEAASQPSPGGGFLLDAHASAPLDGEQLFRQAVSPSPAPLAPPAPRPTAPTPSGPPDDDIPPAIESAVVFRIGGLLAIALGVVLFLDTRELAAPLVLLVAGLIATFYLGSPTRLLREQVVDRWTCLIDGAEGRGSTIMAATIARIEQQALPAVAYEQRQFAASLLRGGRRPFLVVTQHSAGRLRPYKMYVNIRDYGSNVQASWFLIYHRSFFERVKPNPLVQLNLFDEQDLRAAVTAVHHAFLDGVIELMISLGQDASTLDRKTNGFLGIS